MFCAKALHGGNNKYVARAGIGKDHKSLISHLGNISNTNTSLGLFSLIFRKCIEKVNFVIIKKKPLISKTFHPRKGQYFIQKESNNCLSIHRDRIDDNLKLINNLYTSLKFTCEKENMENYLS